MVGIVAASLVLAGAALAHHRTIEGKAVYYAHRYVGETMACGGEYRHKKLVAAHRTLPCGTRLRVRNKHNGRTVTVTVRDRGPYGDDDLVLDVSRRAARELGFIDRGEANIKAVVLHD